MKRSAEKASKDLWIHITNVDEIITRCKELGKVWDIRMGASEEIKRHMKTEVEAIFDGLAKEKRFSAECMITESDLRERYNARLAELEGRTEWLKIGCFEYEGGPYQIRDPRGTDD